MKKRSKFTQTVAAFMASLSMIGAPVTEARTKEENEIKAK